MAVKLNVVRQTVSKWENGLSVPDADVLIRIAELLEVSVSQLLDMEEDINTSTDLSEELAKLNEQLAQKKGKGKAVIEGKQEKRRDYTAFIFGYADRLNSQK